MDKDILNIIITVLASVIPLLSVILTLIYKYSKDKKIKENVEKVNFWVNEANKYVREAEKLINAKSEDKKKFVIDAVMKSSMFKNYGFDEKQVGDIVEDIITTTKLVNNKKDLVVEKQNEVIADN